jgi:hypothetical protein
VTWDVHGVSDEDISSWISCHINWWFSTNTSEELAASIITAVKEDKLLGAMVALYRRRAG